MEVDNTDIFTKAKAKDFDIDEFIEDAAVGIATPELASEPPAEPTIEPTPVPTVALETVTDKEMILQHNFGERTGAYTGEVLDGLPHGQGIFWSINKNGYSYNYEGEWISGHYNGQGTITYENGDVYMGRFQNDYMNGQAKMYKAGILEYEGECSNGHYNGQGALYDTHGEVIFAGDFVSGFISETAEQRSARIGAFIEQSASVSYQELFDYAQNGTSFKVEITGTVAQVFEDEQYNGTILLHEQGEASRIIRVKYKLSEGESKLQMGQTITVWGTTEYLYSYISVEGKTFIVPLIRAWIVEEYTP